MNADCILSGFPINRAGKNSMEFKNIFSDK